MAIVRRVMTEVRCDVCGEWVMGWDSFSNGVSKGWAKYFAREAGHATGKRGVTCKECRIKEKMKKCKLIKEHGTTQVEESRCVGYAKSNSDDEPCERCKMCISHTSFDWNEYKRKIEERKR